MGSISGFLQRPKVSMFDTDILKGFFENEVFQFFPCKYGNGGENQ